MLLVDVNLYKLKFWKNIGKCTKIIYLSVVDIKYIILC